MRSTKKLSVGCLAAGLLFGVTGCGSTTETVEIASASRAIGPTPAPVTITTSPTVTSPAPPVPTSRPQLDAVNAKAMQGLSQRDFEVSTLEAGREQPAVSAEEAMERSAAEFGRPPGKGPNQMSLVRYTNRVKAGEPLPDSGRKASTAFTNRLAWLLVIEDYVQPVFAPPGADLPDDYTTSLAVFIDARDGSFIEAVTIGDTRL